MSKQSFTVEAEHAGERLDQALAALLQGFSRRQAQRAIDAGQVMVDGRPGRKGQLLPLGATVTVEATAPEADAPDPDLDLDLEILYSDAHVIAINKPAGVPTHPRQAEELGCVTNFLAARYPETVGIGDSDCGLVHRLDNETSGVLLAARNQAAYDDLRQQFQQRRVDKEYVAIVEGKIFEEASIDGYTIHDGRDRRRMRVVDRGTAGARYARSEIRPLELLGRHTLVAIKMKTGVRHQIRLHLASIGHPILGDAVYGDEGQKFHRHFLHACYVSYRNPGDHSLREVRSESPPEFGKQASRLRGVWRHKQRQRRAGIKPRG